MTRSTFILLTGSKSDIDEVGGNGGCRSTLGHCGRLWGPVEITCVVDYGDQSRSRLSLTSICWQRNYLWRKRADRCRDHRTIGVVAVDQVVPLQIARWSPRALDERASVNRLFVCQQTRPYAIWSASDLERTKRCSRRRLFRFAATHLGVNHGHISWPARCERMRSLIECILQIRVKLTCTGVWV